MSSPRLFDTAKPQNYLRKGRRADTHGSKCPTHKLTEKDVAEIRKSRLTGIILSKKYKVTISTISSVRTRQNWSHLP